jgi:hypothetical protein
MNLGDGNVKSPRDSREVRSFITHIPNLIYFGLDKFVCGVDFSNWRRESGPRHVPAFYNLIPIIICYCSKPKMCWAHAFRKIPIRAVMEYIHSIWDWPKVENPTSARRYNNPVSPTSSIYLAVTLRAFASCPNPTTFGYYYFIVKSLWKVGRQSLRFKIFRGNSVLHNQSSFWLCRVLGCFNSAGTFLFNANGVNLSNA